MPTYVAAATAVVAQETGVSTPELVKVYTLLALVKGEQTTLIDVHDAWALWKMSTRPDHWSLVPFAELAEEVQAKDQRYVDGIHRAARRLAQRT